LYKLLYLRRVAWSSVAKSCCLHK